MFYYDGVTSEQILATRALLKLLRFLRVCGYLELKVRNKLTTGELPISYAMVAGEYHPKLYILPSEEFEKILGKKLMKL